MLDCLAHSSVPCRNLGIGGEGERSPRCFVARPGNFYCSSIRPPCPCIGCDQPGKRPDGRRSARRSFSLMILAFLACGFPPSVRLNQAQRSGDCPFRCSGRVYRRTLATGVARCLVPLAAPASVPSIYFVFVIELHWEGAHADGSLGRPACLRAQPECQRAAVG